MSRLNALISSHVNLDTFSLFSTARGATGLKI